jgi:N12 class adenine-specific DNA methylase
MSKRSFNEEYLHSAYPEDILQNVLLGKAIYDGKNKVKTDDGFEQNIQNADVDISYKVTSNAVFFKDKKNAILLKLKDTNEQ